MPEWVTVAIVACAILRGDHNLPTDRRDEIAQTEAQAFVDSVGPRLPLALLMAVGYVESRFNPFGSQGDRDNGMWGVMQIEGRALRCWGRVHGRRHDDPSACTDSDVIARRARLLDPTQNIAIGARMLLHRYEQIHAQRHDASVYRDWVGAYFWGSAPPAHGHRRQWLRVRAYAARVHSAMGLMQHQLAVCRDVPTLPAVPR